LDERDLVVVKEAVTPEDSAPELKQKAEELFEREAKILMKLDHPHVVKVLDYFAASGRNYMMLEYVNGRDLRQYVKQNGRVREAVVLEWAEQIASVLQYLHQQTPPVIHRDFTPDNIVVRDDGQIVVIDFGAANEFIGNSTGTFVGKQCYIAPEQFRGKAVPVSDVYAFGCSLNFLLTGQDPEALSTSHPRNINELVSQEMDAFVCQCTDASPEKRPSSSQLSYLLDGLTPRSTETTVASGPS
jgi:serine/threonine-protein kinase